MNQILQGTGDSYGRALIHAVSNAQFDFLH